VLKTPKNQVLLAFGLLLAIATPAAGGWNLVAPHVLAAVLIACLVDVVYERLEYGRWLVPTSAAITGLIVAFVLAPRESWLVCAWAGGFAVLTKRVIRTRREHIFNPAALALVWAPIAFGSGESWWGGLADLPWPWLAIVLIVGLVIVDWLNKLPLVLSFLFTYFGVFTALAYFSSAPVAEMFRDPFLQAAVFLALFMLTDPPTSPNRGVDQVWFGALAAVGACAAQLAGAGQVYLLIGVLVANAGLAARRFAQRRTAARMRIARAT
jgi:Na+-translocating ferredoxin:NAD+ oxidoreductase RnfD subunit